MTIEGENNKKKKLNTRNPSGMVRKAGKTPQKKMTSSVEWPRQ
jgi:hypothetical protein